MKRSVTQFTCDVCGARAEEEWVTLENGAEVRPLPEGWARVKIDMWPDKVRGEYCSLACVCQVIRDLYQVPDQPNTTQGGEA